MNTLATEVAPDGNVGGGTPANYTTTYGYDADGDVTSVTSPPVGGVNYESTSTYDADGEELTTVAPDGNVSGGTPATYTTTNTFNADGDLCWSFNGVSTNACSSAPTGSTKYTYDADNLATSVKDAAATSVTTTAYDADGNVCWTLQATSMSTNACASAPSGSTKYGYDADNNQTSVTDQSGNETQYFYADGAYPSLMTKKEAPTVGGTTPTTTYSYDNDGNLTETVDPEGVDTFDTYNADSQPCLTSTGGSASSSCASAPSGATTYEAYAYNALGDVCWSAVGALPSSGCSTSSSGATVTNEDAAGRVTSVVDQNTKTVTYGYDASGNNTCIGYPIS